jgi:hypothetical protein
MRKNNMFSYGMVTFFAKATSLCMDVSPPNSLLQKVLSARETASLEINAQDWPNNSVSAKDMVIQCIDDCADTWRSFHLNHPTLSEENVSCILEKLIIKLRCLAVNKKNRLETLVLHPDLLSHNVLVVIDKAIRQELFDQFHVIENNGQYGSSANTLDGISIIQAHRERNARIAARSQKPLFDFHCNTNGFNITLLGSEFCYGAKPRIGQP